MGKRTNPRDFVSNWTRSDLPFTTKLRLALRNNLIKATRLQHCCGHHGEPGC